MKQRDIELLSSYLDGQLGSSDVARLEARLLTDRELRSVLRDLRSTRSALRQLPMRKAPRNFTLTPKMVGKNPPLPRAYPAFRFTTALATLLLFLTFGVNFLRPQLASAPRAFGMGGGGSPDETFSAQAPAAAATQAPAATEAPALAATQAPTEAPAPVVGMAPVATMTTSAAEDTARAVVETPSEKSAATANSAASSAPVEPPPQVLGAQPAQVQPPVVSVVWQWLLAGVALASAFIMALMRQLSINRWRRK